MDIYISKMDAMCDIIYALCEKHGYKKACEIVSKMILTARTEEDFKARAYGGAYLLRCVAEAMRRGEMEEG